MKTNKNHNQFMNKFCIILNKFKDNSTVHVGHEQLKTFFIQFTLKDIIIPFITKMDTSEQLTDRQKRQYSKVYVSLIETYKDEILLDSFFQKLMESLNKKSSGVSEVIAYICKTLLNRIQDPQSLYPYVSIIINIFHNHVQIAKILKQLIEIIDSSVISSLQEEIISILHDRINNAKLKNQFLDAILSLVLNMEEKLTVQSQVCSFLSKYLKNQDWNCRKICVDIAYAFLVINHGISENLHSIIKELKYDKIKHVRDSVNNYQVLYKQTYGEEIVQKTVKSQSTFRQAKIKSQQVLKKVTKSPPPIVEKQQTLNIRERANSQSKGKVKNQNFFKNAKNSDVIKINQNNKSSFIQNQHVPIDINNNFSVQIPKVKIEQIKISETKGNFQEYLKKRNSPKNSLPIPQHIKPSLKQVDKSTQKASNVRVGDLNEVPKFNYDKQLQNFKKKNRGFDSNAVANQQFKQSSSFSAEVIRNSQQDISLSFAESKVYNSAHDQLISMFKQFEKKINQRLDSFDRRIQTLEERQNSSGESYTMQKGRILDQREQPVQKMREESPKSVYYNQTSQSKWQSSISQNVQSNLEEKVRLSISNQNWDEAFTLALTNNKKSILLSLLERCVFPTDKTVQQCILLQIKKLLGYTGALKWLKYFLSQKNLSQARLMKLKQDLHRRTVGDNKNYQLMKQLVLNQINQKLNFQQ